jgi:hypothetical protein
MVQQRRSIVPPPPAADLTTKNRSSARSSAREKLTSPQQLLNVVAERMNSSNTASSGQDRNVARILHKQASVYVAPPRRSSAVDNSFLRRYVLSTDNDNDLESSLRFQSFDASVSPSEPPPPLYDPSSAHGGAAAPNLPPPAPAHAEDPPLRRGRIGSGAFGRSRIFKHGASVESSTRSEGGGCKNMREEVRQVRLTLPTLPKMRLFSRAFYEHPRIEDSVLKFFSVEDSRGLTSVLSCLLIYAAICILTRVVAAATLPRPPPPRTRFDAWAIANICTTFGVALISLALLVLKFFRRSTISPFARATHVAARWLFGAVFAAQVIDVWGGVEDPDVLVARDFWRVFSLLIFHMGCVVVIRLRFPAQMFAATMAELIYFLTGGMILKSVAAMLYAVTLHATILILVLYSSWQRETEGRVQYVRRMIAEYEADRKSLLVNALLPKEVRVNFFTSVQVDNQIKSYRDVVLMYAGSAFSFFFFAVACRFLPPFPLRIFFYYFQ